MTPGGTAHVVVTSWVTSNSKENMKVTITITQKWEFKTEAHSLALAKERAKELMKTTKPKLTMEVK